MPSLVAVASREDVTVAEAVAALRQTLDALRCVAMAAVPAGEIRGRVMRDIDGAEAMLCPEARADWEVQ